MYWHTKERLLSYIPYFPGMTGEECLAQFFGTDIALVVAMLLELEKDGRVRKCTDYGNTTWSIPR